MVQEVTSEVMQRVAGRGLRSSVAKMETNRTTSEKEGGCCGYPRSPEVSQHTEWRTPDVSHPFPQPTVLLATLGGGRQCLFTSSEAQRN